ncbi:hypothetical protein Lalb_Chr06g0164941 [Lupinus albus]|uniref:Uncharacterized protein n=1 Tax=Lupinus albus TaxID=3870 RepID=A0A6A4QCX5_LUPAL|nr:hypothetical protein Lalb_Chr06g0164941 [Lupinus albus]
MHFSSSYQPIAPLSFGQSCMRLILALLRQMWHISASISPLHNPIAYTLLMSWPYERL